MFKVINDDNKEISCELLFTFNENNKDFIVYKDNEDIIASLYKIDNENIIIIPITDDADFDIVDRELEKRDINV